MVIYFYLQLNIYNVFKILGYDKISLVNTKHHNLTLYISFKYLRTDLIAITPSLTAEEIPAKAVKRTSPEVKMPGTLISGFINKSII